MQKIILQRKKEISFISLFLIITAFIGHYAFKNEFFGEILLIIASVIGFIPILIQAYQSLKVKVISIDVLVTIAVIGAFIIKNYEESAIVSFLFLFGNFLEQRTLNKTRKAIYELTQMAPKKALKKMDDHHFMEVDIEDVNIDDVLLVKTGSQIPVDGKVIEGKGYANEASITGESIPVVKELNAKVYAGTILENGTLKIEAEKVGEDTLFGKIIELVEEAQDSKSKTEKFINNFSKYYTPLVLLLGIISYIIWQDIELAITILVLGCPGALVIGIPVSNVAGIGNGAKNGVLLKGSEVVSDLSQTDVIIFDKTGTLTIGNPEVFRVKEYSEDVSKAYDYLKAVEKESDHPLASAIVRYVKEKENYKVSDTKVIKGKGVIATVEGKKIIIGNQSLLKSENIHLNETVLNDIKDFETKGASIVLVALDNELNLLIGIKDQIRKNVKEELESIRKLKVKRLIVLSGDNQGSVNLVAKELNLTEAHGNMSPIDKQNYVKKLQKEGHVVMFVGDGVNDSPSLALAHIGIAMGGGTDVAIETSDVVLMNSNISNISYAIALSKTMIRNMKQNIIIALGVVLTLLVSLLASDWMNMSIGMLVHELSILVVIINGMRLLKFKNKKRRKEK
ncbi:MAG: heavy metal translocating P-type ATPase [Candidatus Phytoplasma sp.]|nr:heavy metal translocating P-type ATPase [Phytoplasma sp.]